MSVRKATRRPKARASAAKEAPHRTAAAYARIVPKATLPKVLEDALERQKKRKGRKPDGTQQRRLARFRQGAVVIADKTFSAAFNEMFALSMDLAAPTRSITFVDAFYAALRTVLEDRERHWKALTGRGGGAS